LFFLLSNLLIIQSLSAQDVATTGAIRGHVYDIETGEPISYATVVIDGSILGTNTDDSGFFNLSDIPTGNRKLKVSFIGYEDYLIPIEVKKTTINYYKVEMTTGGVTLGVVDISAERQQARTEVRISKLQVSKKQIKALPSTGGDADVLQYLAVVPGVISTGDQGGQLFIRGGSPIQNKIMIDGLTIYNPFHSIGFYSTFETEIIRNVDVLTGGFNADHGGRISAIVDIRTRAGNQKKLSGQLSVSPFMGKALIEGPLTKNENGGNLSFILTAKKSLIKEVSKTVYNYAVENDTVGLPFDFTDTYAKLTYNTPNGSKFSFFGFNYDDQFDNPAVSTIEWNNRGGGIFFDLLPSASALTMDGLVGLSSYDISIVESGDNNPRSSSITEGNLSLDFKYLTNISSVKYGIDIKSISTDFNFTNPFGIAFQEKQNTTEIAGYLTYRRAWNKLVIEPGFRLQYYASLGEFSPEPRIGIKYNITDDLRFKAGGGLYSQNLISTSNERDVVNLFSGFISGPESRIFDYDGKSVSTKLQKARHVLAGIEKDLGSNLQVNLEGYYKEFTQLIVINRNKIRQSDSDYSTEEGDAFGLDISAKYETAKWYLWATYSIGMVTRFDGEQEYPTLFDRRHNVNFLTTYTVGRNNDILLSLRWNMGSGFPFTKTVAFYDNLVLDEGVGTPIETDNSDNIGIIYSDERNGGRLPYYHRLDLSAQKTFTLNDRFNVDVIATVTNAYDRDNIFYFDRIKFDRVNQLPILPALSAKLNF